MSAPPPAPPAVPATALGRFNQTTLQTSQLVIGQDHLYGMSLFNPDTPLYWYVVVDLTNLNVVANVALESETEVPPEVLQYLGNSRYFLFLIGNALYGYNIPQGQLYEFLTSI